MTTPVEDTGHEHFLPEAALENLLVYVKWSVVQKWKTEARPVIESSREKWGPQLPYVYASGNNTFKRYVRPRTVIWVVTCPEYGTYRLPPTLVACLHVQDAVPRDGGESGEPDPRIPEWYRFKWSWVAIACPECSTYLPVNNAFDRLKRLRSLNVKNEKSPILDELNLPGSSGPYTYAPHQLRFVKRLANEGTSGLIAHAREVEGRRTIFVSYCRRDRPPEFAGHLVEELMREGFAPWLDMKAVPARVSTGEVRLEPGILDKVLEDGIRQARTFVAIVGADYLESTYAMKEWQVAVDRSDADPEAICLQVSLAGHRLEWDGPDAIPATTPTQTAKRIRELVEEC
jgi:hypothetical protein